MGGNVSREISINEDEASNNMPRSATLPMGLKGIGEKLTWSGTLPRGLGLDSSFSVKLTKSKKLDNTPSKTDLDETKVEIIKNNSEDNTNDDDDETMKDFIEALLIQLMEDALLKVGDSKMKKSLTLPAGFRGLSQSQGFGKRIRQSIRKLVPAKKVIEEQEEASGGGEVQEETIADSTHLSEEASENVENIEEAEVTVSSIKNKSLPFSSVKKQIQISVRKLISKKKKPKKESIMLVNSIIDDIIREVEGEEEEVLEESESKKEEEKDAETIEKETVEAPELTENDDDSKENAEEESEIGKTGVLDKSND